MVCVLVLALANGKDEASSPCTPMPFFPSATVFSQWHSMKTLVILCSINKTMWLELVCSFFTLLCIYMSLCCQIKPIKLETTK